MGSASENFCLRWNDFESNVSGAFRELRSEADFFDVTLACDQSAGRTLQAHKVILSACSSFFKQMLRNASASSPNHPCPLIYLRGVRMTDLEAILDFMYNGEVNVAQEDLNSFLAVAEDLQIKGLTQAGGARGKGAKKSQAGPQAKRARRDYEEDVKDIKNEPTGATTFESGASTSVGAAGGDTSFDADASYTDPPTQDAGPYGAGAFGGGTDEAIIEQGIELDTSQDTTKVPQTPVGTTGQQVTDLNELVMGLLSYSDGVHTCNLCGKKSPWRTTMLRHVEANHVETAGHVCDICGQISKTRHAFGMHKKRKHNVNMANEPLPERPQQRKE